MKIPISSRKQASGFTLIELMVAMTITAIIVGVLVSITGIALDAWQRGKTEVRASRQAKSFLDTMAKDFESMVSRRGNKFEWLYSNINLTPPGPESNKSSNSSDLYFFTSATDRYDGNVGGTADKGGDVCCVGYRLQYQDPIKGANGGDDNSDAQTFVVYRKLVNPDDTFKTALGTTDLKTAFSKFETGLQEPSNFVCENVYQFTLTFEVEVVHASGSGSGKSTIIPARVTLGKGVNCKRFNVLGSGIDTDGKVQDVTDSELIAGRVKSVEIGVTVLSDSAIKRLAQPGIKQETRDKIMAQEAFHYSRNAVIPTN